MRSILLKGMDNSYKSNIFLLKSTIEKINTNRNIINKNPTKSKLILKNKKTNIHDIYFPSTEHFNKRNDNSLSDKIPYCSTEGDVLRNSESNTKKNDIFFKKIMLLPKIKESNRSLSKRHINLGFNKYSINLNLGTALSYEKMLINRIKKLKLINQLRDQSDKSSLFVKKILLKEFSLNKNKSESRGRIIGNPFKIKKILDYSKKEEQNKNMNMNMNDIIISNDFHGHKIINYDESRRKNKDKFHIYKKFKKEGPLNKRSGNNNEYEKNQSIDTNSLNKKIHFRSFQNITKLSPPRKISKTISSVNNSECKNNNVYAVNLQKNVERKIKHYNDDIINLLNDSN